MNPAISRRQPPKPAVLLAGLFVAAMAAAATAQLNDQMPEELDGVGVTENLEAQLPLDLEFTDSEGGAVTLADYFDGDKPVLLTMNYSDCPMLCSLQLNGLFRAMQAMSWEMGDQYDMVTVSIDPLETSQRAAQTKSKYLDLYGRPGAAAGFHVLTGKEENIKKVARTVGFGYTYLPETKEYAHAAVVMVCTPDGKVSRYLYGVEYDPQTLKFSLLEAGEGKVGSTLDQVILYCFHYDAEAGRYGPAAFRLMQVGAAFTLVVLGSVLGAFWWRERRKASSPPGDDDSSSDF